ncbi:hypothetical protein OUZ56_014813 [Daphnia magna]|uniref:Uncharacterized protein n=1 Tax=Daphnia magna TaxID=35525 RepID=A0ABR0AKW8_9CRUS|nr:hypothetical protein OUZ56_014813 [Daphnia magna]
MGNPLDGAILKRHFYDLGDSSETFAVASFGSGYYNRPCCFRRFIRNHISKRELRVSSQMTFEEELCR